MSEAEKEAEISSLKNPYEKRNRSWPGYGSFLEVPLLKN